ncbi:hypothetical protein VHEMI07889 [[Torrubiella] hemipterigena]|uniref:Uncharacterized protein n=1 Tax=[Torrubiella] hemipterigena TaxID=1531966 RepID=A0A0A1TMJ2_9HYPO|nr:hypothetical protein VHEMI07889 [[Torrubiella] hemipterigena]
MLIYYIVAYIKFNPCSISFLNRSKKLADDTRLDPLLSTDTPPSSVRSDKTLLIVNLNKHHIHSIFLCTTYDYLSPEYYGKSVTFTPSSLMMVVTSTAPFLSSPARQESSRATVLYGGIQFPGTRRNRRNIPPICHAEVSF